jgi:hypothetical protein
MCIEQLPVELFLIIFSYLEGNDLMKAFANLNIFFYSLLQSPLLQIHFRLKKEEIEFPHIFVENIQSLSDNKYDRYVHQFIDLHLSNLKHLQSLTINVDDYNSSPICSLLTKFIHLKYLCIGYIAVDSTTNEDILSVIFSLPTLRACILDVDDLRSLDKLKNDSVPSNNSIEHLNIKNWIKTSLLHSILQQLSRLRSLQTAYLERNTTSLLPENIIPSLKIITLTGGGIQVSDFEEISQKLPGLESISAGPASVDEIQFEEMLFNHQWTTPFDRIKRVDIEVEWSFIMEGKREDMRTRIPQSHPWLSGPFYRYSNANNNEHIFSFHLNLNRNMAKKFKWVNNGSFF